MKTLKRILAFSIVVAVIQQAQAQSYILSSPCNGTFSRNSLFFDLQITNNLILDDIAILSQNCGTRDMKIYYKQGTYLGFNSNPAAWTLLDSTFNFNPTCALSCPIPPTVIPFQLNLCLVAGQTYGFYIAMTGGTGTLETHNLLPAGSIGAQDANLKLITGEGHNGTTPFNTSGTLTTGLTLEGEFHYHLPDVSLGNDTAICSGDSLLLNAGPAFSTFLWSNGATTQSIYAIPGTYTVLVDAGACQAIDTILIGTQPCSNVVASLFSSDTGFCEKKCIDFFDLSTNNPTSWLWFFPGADTTSSIQQNPSNICYNSYGSFDVTLIACNATTCDTLFLPGFINSYQNPPPPVITSSADTLFSTTGYTYQWYDSSGAIPGATGSWFVYNNEGSYYVVIADSNGCETSSSVIYSGVGETDRLSLELQVVPNPNNGQFTIYMPGSGNRQVVRLDVFDRTGLTVTNKLLQPGTLRVDLDLSHAGEGLYLLRIQSTRDVFFSKVLITGLNR